MYVVVLLPFLVDVAVGWCGGELNHFGHDFVCDQKMASADAEQCEKFAN